MILGDDAIANNHRTAIVPQTATVFAANHSTIADRDIFQDESRPGSHMENTLNVVAVDDRLRWVAFAPNGGRPSGIENIKITRRRKLLTDTIDPQTVGSCWHRNDIVASEPSGLHHRSS